MLIMGRLTMVAILIGTLSVLAACVREPEHDRSVTSGNEYFKLKMVHWIGTEAGTVVSEINDRFHKEYPNIEVQVEYAPVDQYQSIIRSRFVSGSAPDLLGVFPGKWQEPFVDSGFLMDLSESVWASRLEDDARTIMTIRGKLYAMPVNRNAIGVLYDKKWFQKMGLSLPHNWEQFLELCELIKRQGHTPIALGLKDQWVTQIIPFAMAPSAIYRDRPNFDNEMYTGDTSFSDSPWRKMLLDYVNLEHQGYFNKGYLDTTYDQMVQMLATGKAAMMVMGNWALGPIEMMNPDAEIGMFPLPYVDGDEPIWLSSGVSIGIGASSSTRFPEEVKQYLAFLSRPEINKLFLEKTKSFSVFQDISPALNETLQQIEPALKTGSYHFLDQNWPPGVQDKLFQVIQELMAGANNHSVGQSLSELDRVFKTHRFDVFVP